LAEEAIYVAKTLGKVVLNLQKPTRIQNVAARHKQQSSSSYVGICTLASDIYFT
jgi:hypothetical protein